MNYYPNYYMNNYPYNGNNNGQYIPQNPPYVPMNQQSPQLLNGKIVDSEDMVRVTEVPIGGFGIFPKADLSEVFIKTWNKNGTTSIISFVPTTPIQEAQNDTQQDSTIMKILNKINALEIKIDSLTNNNNNIEKRKEIKANEY